MSDIKKEHAIGTGTGAVAGAIAGAAVGIVAGPIGVATGAVFGSLLGAGAGNSIAEAVNPSDYTAYWKANHAAAPYYQPGLAWDDYQPAYDLGYAAYGRAEGRTFDDIEAELQRTWDATRGDSSLAWVDARGAVHDGWTYVERGRPADVGTVI